MHLWLCEQFAAGRRPTHHCVSGSKLAQAGMGQQRNATDGQRPAILYLLHLVVGDNGNTHGVLKGGVR